jgi:hypothetical protein
MGCSDSGAAMGSAAGPGLPLGQSGMRRSTGGEVPGSSSSPAYKALILNGTSQECVAWQDPQYRR